MRSLSRFMFAVAASAIALVAAAADPATGVASQRDTGLSTPDALAARASAIDRFVVPAPRLLFEGEMGRRSLTFAVTEAQSRHSSILVVTLNSSIFVAPEASRLQVEINGQPLAETPLVASGMSYSVTVPVPSGLLKAGRNLLTFIVEQRHRTDCTLDSTYDLWTEIHGAGTGLIFERKHSPIASIDDLAAVGFDASGTTTIRLVLPGDIEQSRQQLLRLVQAVALVGEFPQPVVTVASSPPDSWSPGTVQVAVGTAQELSGVVGLSAIAHTAPYVDFLAGPTPTLVASGPDERAVSSAIRQIVNYVERSPNGSRGPIGSTQSHSPIPFLEGARRLKFSELGIPSEKFDGRRFQADFHIALPQDFYAMAYGKAILYLDAAYTDKVKRGGSVDVYVNGSAAASMPLTSSKGQVFRHIPIKIPLTHFQAGVNHVAVEAQLESNEDDTCAIAGASGGGTSDRFALFDTSEFHMPNFARIDRWPDLSALAGAGGPYATSRTPVKVVFGRQDKEILAAASTFIVRLAVSAGRLIPTTVPRALPQPTEAAIFFGVLSDFPPSTVAAMGIDPGARVSWRLLPSDASKEHTTRPQSNEFAAGRARTKEQQHRPSTLLIVGDSWRAVREWVDHSMAQLWLSFSPSPAFAGPFHPNEHATLIVTAAPASSKSSWIMVAAPAMDYFVRDMSEVVRGEHWQKLSGKIASFSAADGVEHIPPQYRRYEPSSWLSLTNMRFVAANWLSENILFFALALLSSCIALGVVSSALLGRLGKRL